MNKIEEILENLLKEYPEMIEQKNAIRKVLLSMEKNNPNIYISNDFKQALKNKLEIQAYTKIKNTQNKKINIAKKGIFSITKDAKSIFDKPKLNFLKLLTPVFVGTFALFGFFHFFGDNLFTVQSGGELEYNSQKIDESSFSNGVKQIEKNAPSVKTKISTDGNQELINNTQLEENKIQAEKLKVRELIKNRIEKSNQENRISSREVEDKIINESNNYETKEETVNVQKLEESNQKQIKVQKEQEKNHSKSSIVPVSESLNPVKNINKVNVIENEFSGKIEEGKIEKKVLEDDNNNVEDESIDAFETDFSNTVNEVDSHIENSSEDFSEIEEILGDTFEKSSSIHPDSSLQPSSINSEIENILDIDSNSIQENVQPLADIEDGFIDGVESIFGGSSSIIAPDLFEDFCKGKKGVIKNNTCYYNDKECSRDEFTRNKCTEK